MKKLTCTIFVLFCLYFSILYAENDFDVSQYYSLRLFKGFNSKEYSFNLEHIYSYTYMTKQSEQMKKFSFFEDPEGKLLNTSFSINNFTTFPYRYWEYYSDDNSFQSDQKIHYVQLKNDQKIGDVFTIKQQYEFKSIKDMVFINIPRRKSLKRMNFEIYFPKELKVKVTPIFIEDSLSYRIINKADYVSVIFDSLNYLNSTEYFNNSNNFAYLHIEISKDGQILNPSQPSDLIEKYLEEFPEYPNDFKLYIDMLTKFPGNETIILDSVLTDKNITEKQKKYVYFKAIGTTPVLKSRLLDLINTTNTKSNDLEKLQVIFNFVQKNIRYISKSDSIYTIYPHNPIEVLQNSYGDCKDFSYLIKTLAKQCNVEVELALLNTQIIPLLNPISLEAFNHMIAVYKSNDQVYFMDATDQYCNFGEVPRDFYNLPYLILNPNQKEIEYFPPIEGQSEMYISIQCSEEIPNSGTAKIEFRRALKSSFMFNQTSMDDITTNNFLSEITSSNFAHLSFKNFKKSSVSDSLVIIESDVDLSKFFIQSDKKTYIRKQAFIVSSNEILKRRDDPYGLFIKMPIDIHLTMTLPKKLNLFDDQSDIIEHQSFYYHSKLEHHREENVLSYKLQIQPKIYKQQEKTEILSLFEKLINQKKDMYIFKKGE